MTTCASCVVYLQYVVYAKHVPGHEEIVARTTLCLVRLVQLYMDATKQVCTCNCHVRKLSHRTYSD